MCNLCSLAGGGFSNFLAQEREALLSAMVDPNVAVSNALDLWDLQSPYGDIHPRNKQTVRARAGVSSVYFTMLVLL